MFWFSLLLADLLYIHLIKVFAFSPRMPEEENHLSSAHTQVVTHFLLEEATVRHSEGLGS